jgi:hypothetical protein
VAEGPAVIRGAVEGPSDEAVLARPLRDAGAEAGDVYAKEGKGPLLEKIVGYNDAAGRWPWVVLGDLVDRWSKRRG